MEKWQENFPSFLIPNDNINDLLVALVFLFIVIQTTNNKYGNSRVSEKENRENPPWPIFLTASVVLVKLFFVPFSLYFVCFSLISGIFLFSLSTSSSLSLIIHGTFFRLSYHLVACFSESWKVWNFANFGSHKLFDFFLFSNCKIKFKYHQISNQAEEKKINLSWEFITFSAPTTKRFQFSYNRIVDSSELS